MVLAAPMCARRLVGIALIVRALEAYTAGEPAADPTEATAAQTGGSSGQGQCRRMPAHASAQLGGGGYGGKPWR